MQSINCLNGLHNCFKKISICSKDCDICLNSLTVCSNGFCFRPETENACLKNCDISGQTITLNWRCSCLTLSYPFDVSSKGAINLTINFSHQILITYFQFGPVIFVTKFVVKLILLTLISPWIYSRAVFFEVNAMQYQSGCT